MENFSKDILKKLTNNYTIERADKIYKKGFIKELKIDPYYSDNSVGENFCKVDGEIYMEDGFVYKNSYKSSFIYSMDSDRFKVGKLSCNCNKFKDDKSTCPHIGAIIIKTIDDYVFGDKDEKLLQTKNIFIKEPPSINIDKLILSLSESPLNHKLIPLELESSFEHFDYKYGDPYIKVSFSIGIHGEKKYKITNIPDFLEAKSRGITYQFGKKFAYDESIYYFNEDDEKIIDYMMDIYNLVNIHRSEYTYNDLRWTDVHPRNSLDLKGENLIKFLRIFKDKSISLTESGKTIYPKVLFQDPPINFLIEKNDSGYFVRMNKKLIALDKNFRIFLFEGDIYVVSTSQSKALYSISTSMNKADYFRVNKNDKAKFLTKVLPEISSKFDAQLKNMENEVVKEDLIIKSYLDKYKDEISVTLQYNYGENVINPLSKKEGDVFILRDSLLEKSVESELAAFGFTNNDEKEEYVLNGDEKIYRFVDYGIPSLLEKSEVFYSEDFKKIKLYKNVNLSSYVKINNESLIDIEFSLEGINNDEIANILKSIRENKKYHRLKDGSILNIQNDELGEFSDLMDSLDADLRELNRGKVVLDKAKAFYLESRIEENKNKFLVATDTFKKFMQDIDDLKSKEFEFSEPMKNALRNYQEIGSNWLCAMHYISLGGILADEMGLGKTIQSIAFMEYYKKDTSKFLIICPSSVVYNWKSEIERFSKGLSSLIIDGVKSKRESLIKSIDNYDVIITSYALMRKDYELYESFFFDSVIIDEAQNIKNHNTINAFSVKNLKSKSKFALTGTPLENSLGELWSIFDFILPSYLGKYAGFKSKYELPIVANKDEVILKDLLKKINPFILRRLKKEVSEELPDKIETKFVVELSKDQKKLYAAYVKSIKEEIDDSIHEVGIKRSQIKILAGLTRLRQLCCDPSSFIKDYDGANNKMDALIELIEENVESNHKILVFSQFTTVLKNISRKL
ncbi:MAG: SNF2 helicase associated domain-containing protein, partial [Oscillospiraceae bacterium]|nr:SNF2 helicase associated domain-containing protein [Oscillospiraceae bacterium]